MNLEGLNPISERFRPEIFSTGPSSSREKMLTIVLEKMTICVANDIMTPEIFNLSNALISHSCGSRNPETRDVTGLPHARE
jgi:hypothetical protein